jgi:hypothetical protein
VSLFPKTAENKSQQLILSSDLYKTSSAKQRSDLQAMRYELESVGENSKMGSQPKPDIQWMKDLAVGLQEAKKIENGYPQGWHNHMFQFLAIKT